MSLRICLSITFLVISSWSAVGQRTDSVDTPDAKSRLGSLADKLNRLKATRQSQSAVNASSQRNPVYDRILKSVGYIEIRTDDGGWNGTGWVVDAEQRLMVTNQHVIEGMLNCSVYFPEYVNGELNTDPDTSLTADRERNAVVIDSDETVDLALIQLDEALPKGIIALELADESARPGAAIHSVAGNTAGSESLWSYSTGHVRQIVERSLANGYETIVLESDMATNQGNSGGPVCNDQGQVVAVVEGAMTEARLVSMDVELQALAEYLGNALRCVEPKSIDDLRFTAQRHLDAGRSGVALRFATNALKKSKSAELYCLRGWCWYWYDDNDAARGDFQDALEINGDFAEAQYGLATIASFEGDDEAAIELYTDAIRNDPGNVTYLNDRGFSRHALGQYVKAKKDFESALHHDSISVAATCGKAYCEAELGETESALNTISSVLDYVTDDPQAMYYCGVLMRRTENHEAAVHYFQLTTELDPDYSWAHYFLGVSLLDLNNGRHEEALAALQVQFDQTPDDTDTMFYLGMALIQNSKLDEGLALCEKAARLAPDNADIQEAIQIVRKAVGARQATTNNVGFATPQTATPVQYVGTWTATIRGQGTLHQLTLALGSNGRYDMTMLRRNGSAPAETNHETGAFVIQGKELRYQPDGTSDTIAIPIRWKGQFLSLYFEHFSGWVSLNKRQQS
ncbi:MAG: trypsin-like peptidase domain-containing protein [Planctomycetota bacterium]